MYLGSLTGPLNKWVSGGKARVTRSPVPGHPGRERCSGPCSRCGTSSATPPRPKDAQRAAGGDKIHSQFSDQDEALTADLQESIGASRYEVTFTVVLSAAADTDWCCARHPRCSHTTRIRGARWSYYLPS